MMRAIARFAARWWWAVIAVWVGAAAVLTVLAPPFEEVATFDEAAFLPADSDTVVGSALHDEAWPDENFSRVASIGLVRPDEELTEEDEEYALELVEWLENDAPPALGDVMTHLRDPNLEGALASEDGHAMLVVVGFDIAAFTPQANDAVDAMRAQIREVNPPPDGLEAYVTGAAAVAADEARAIDASLFRAQILSVFLVIVILLWVFRSPVAPLVPLTMISVSYLISVAVISLLARAGMDVSSLFETFALVIIFGAGTDYGLLLISRYREELALAEDLGFARSALLRNRTIIATTLVLGAVIASSAGTVMVGFSAQGVAEFGLYRTMGPAMAIAIGITLVAGLTLVPAMMKMFGGLLLWPHPGSRHVHPSDRLLVDERADQLGFVRPLDGVSDDVLTGRAEARESSGARR
jgi:putative drug exporter of the RND superfamily